MSHSSYRTLQLHFFLEKLNQIINVYVKINSHNIHVESKITSSRPSNLEQKEHVKVFRISDSEHT